MFRPEFTAKPIGSVAALAAMLRLSQSVLLRISNSVDVLYDEFSILKKDGVSLRKICSPRRELKFIQKRINREIFANVLYPNYLHGGIVERDYVKNAQMHSHSKCLIALDVRDFYPSIKYEHVRSIFKNFCRFPDEVARVLASLTTLGGSVPQGACTSSHLANLVFFENEHRLVHVLEQQKIRYTRLIDDISLSTDKRVFGSKETPRLITKVADLLSTRGMSLKNQKTQVTSSENPETLMEVTGLWLNRGRPRLRRAERHDIRLCLRRVEKSFKISRYDADYHENFNRVSGRVAKLTHIGHFEAPAYRERLRGVLPHFDQPEKLRIMQHVNSLAKSDPTKRGTLEYIQRYFGIRYKINIIRRSDMNLALQLEKLLRACRPTCSKDELIYG